jgi:hypothetical protein
LSEVRIVTGSSVVGCGKRLSSPEGLMISKTLSRHNVSPAKCYLLAAPRANFFTLRFCDPRAYSRGLSGCSVLRFLRAVRLSFLRSSLLNAAVFAMNAIISSIPY